MEDIYYVTLGFLINNQKHGYELYKDFTDKDGVGQIYSIKIGRLYAILKKLEENHLVEAFSETSKNRPPRKVYKITKVGKDKFFDWVNKPIEHGRDIRLGFLLKLYFLRSDENLDKHEVIDSQINECSKWLNLQVKRLEENTDRNNFEFFVYQFRKSQIEGYINWLNWCKRRLINA